MSSAAAAPITMSFERLTQIRHQLFNIVLREIVIAHNLPSAKLPIMFHCLFFFKRAVQHLKYYNQTVADPSSSCYEDFRPLFEKYGGPSEGAFAAGYGKLGNTLCEEFEKQVQEEDLINASINCRGRDKCNEAEIVDMKNCELMFRFFYAKILPKIKDSWKIRYVEFECVLNLEGLAIMDEFILFFMEFTERLFGDAEFDFKAFCDAKVKECQAKVKAAEAEARRAAKAEAKAEAKAGGDA